MASDTFSATLGSRAAVAVGGPEWRSFLQGLLTQDVARLGPDDLFYAALLSPQGRLLFDLFLVGAEEGCLLDCAAGRREALIERLGLYRLRAKVEIAPSSFQIHALWGPAKPGARWRADPRRPELGYRAYGPSAAPENASRVDEAVHDRLRLSLGVGGPADWGDDKTYPIEANFDLLHGIDFHKGCFVGQETTSRMKRRGAVKSRMAPILFDGPPPPYGSELLAGTLRAGAALSGLDGIALALLRLDRLGAGAPTMADGRPWSLALPSWMGDEVQGIGA